MNGRSGYLFLGGKGAPSVARRFVRLLGEDWAEETVESALLLTSELVTNAMLHGGGPATLDVRVSAGTIRIEVYDSGPTPASWLGPGEPGDAPPECADEDLGLGGRGLRIVGALCERWGVTDQPLGKTVWFELSPSPSPNARSRRSSIL